LFKDLLVDKFGSLSTIYQDKLYIYGGVDPKNFFWEYDLGIKQRNI